MVHTQQIVFIFVNF